MKSKILGLFFLVIAFSLGQASAQAVNIATWSQYIPVYSYDGTTIRNGYTVQIDLNRPLQLHPFWSLAVRPTGPIRTLLGKTIDPRRIKLRISETSGNGPSIQEIGATLAPIPLSNSDVFLIRRSRASLSTGLFEFYKSFKITFDVIVEGGDYLEDLRTTLPYSLNLEFTLLNALDQELSSHQSPVAHINIFMLHPAPSNPTYSLQVLGGAVSGTLEFTSPQDFATGIQQTYPGGLSVISSTDYQLQVRTLTSDFTANSLSIPVNTVGLHLRAPSTNREGTVTLSSTNQTVINRETSTGRDARLYDIRYFTLPNDLRLLKAVPANYSTTLMYTLTPQ